MGQIQVVDPKAKRAYDPCLAGIRGYGFLLVFWVHYLVPNELTPGHPLRIKALTAISSLGLFAVPSFFVLSGYLIGGILYHTRHREGYFKVFYTRRILRIFPVFYLTLTAIGIMYLIHGIPLDRYFWSHFFYIHNLLPGYHEHVRRGSIGMIHFWSLAVEEQFYLIWPLVVWLFPDRRKLIGISVILIAFCNLSRLAAPLVLTSPGALGTFTTSRVDAILVGTLIALVKDEPFFARIMPYAKWIVLGGLTTAVFLALEKGAVWADTFSGREVVIPLANYIAAAIVIAVMEPNSVMNRICSLRWACWLGALSYSLYVFHLTFASYFLYVLTPQLAQHMRHVFAALLSTGLAFSSTLALSMLCYWLVERPILGVKDRICYGAEIPDRLSMEVEEEALLAQTGT